MNLIFCGLQKSGKSTIGSIIARKLNLDFIELDECIEKSYHTKYNRRCTCREIYLSEGEAFFRNLENEQIKLLNCKEKVISIGGGAFFEKGNIIHLIKMGTIIYLKSSLEILYERMIKEGMPAYLKTHSFEEYKKLAAIRTPLFEKYATHTIDIDYKNKSQITDEIISVIYGK